MVETCKVLIFGEHENDTHAIKNIIKAFLPEDLSIDIKPLRSPVILNRAAVQSGKRKKMADEIAAFARAMQKTNVPVFVVAHHDCDDVEPAHLEASEVLENELRRSGVENPIAATPAWEIETWWMLFPEAVAKIRQCWRKIDYGKSHVGKIQNSKEQLKRDLRPKERKIKCPDYRESDGVLISREVAKNRDFLRTRARSDSFLLFREKIRERIEVRVNGKKTK
jgi:hypothetical protein